MTKLLKAYNRHTMTLNLDGDPLIANLVTQIDAILPQTQCQQCGYIGCQPYATAIATGEADINQCPPGGEAGIYALADLLNIAHKPLNQAHGEHKAKAVALINESICIGCTLCIQACPVDAILGASKQMHTVIASECTGCELCLPPCPVDCISMEPIPMVTETEKHKAANLARRRYNFKLSRIARENAELAQKHAERAQARQGTNNKQDVIAAAIARAKAQKLSS